MTWSLFWLALSAFYFVLALFEWGDTPMFNSYIALALACSALHDIHKHKEDTL